MSSYETEKGRKLVQAITDAEAALKKVRQAMVGVLDEWHVERRDFEIIRGAISRAVDDAEERGNLGETTEG